jgi:putative FmdB family regulatory protein
MPIYEYRCEADHVFEAMQSFTDDPLTDCEVCGAPVRRVLHSPAIHFKGNGFYATDYARRGAGKSESQESKESKAAEGSSSGTSESSATAAEKASPASTSPAKPAKD